MNHACHAPRVLMFDFDGVLADSLEVFHECLAAACEAQGGPPLRDRGRFLDLFDGNMVDGLRKLGVPAGTLPVLLNDLGGRLAAAGERYPPFPGIVGAVNRLTEAVPVCIITSNLTGVVAAWLDRYGLRGVSEVLGADKEPSKRAKIGRAAARWPGRQPVYIGDTLGDMEEAHAAGALAVAAGWGWHDEGRLRRGRPDRFLTSPADLEDLVADDRVANTECSGQA